MNEMVTRVTLKDGAVIDTAMSSEQVLRSYREALNSEEDQTLTLVHEKKNDSFSVREETSFDSNLVIGVSPIPVVSEQPEPVERPKRQYTRRQPVAEASPNGKPKRTMDEATRAKMSKARKQYWDEVRAGTRPAPKVGGGRPKQAQAA